MGVNVRSFLLNTSNYFSHPSLNSIFIIAFPSFFVRTSAKYYGMVKPLLPPPAPIYFVCRSGKGPGLHQISLGGPGKHLTNVVAHHWILGTHLSYSCCLPFALTFARTSSSSSLIPFCTFLVDGWLNLITYPPC